MSAQNINISTVDVCAEQEVFLPVTGVSLLNVGAITLYIHFDTTNLTFISIENIDPQLAGMSANMMSTPLQLAFAWSSTTPVNFLNDKLFDLKFISNGQTSPVYYYPGCEIADPTGAVIPVIFSNGSVNSNSPVISMQPKDTIVTEGGHASFTVLSTNANSYLWQESHDYGTTWLPLDDGSIYSGTHTPELSIFPVPLSFNKNQFQCILMRENCRTFSISAILSVDALTSAGNTLYSGKKDLFISPVPFYDHTSVEFSMPENGDISLQVLSCLGQLVSEFNLASQTKGPQNILLNTLDWRPGVYFVKLTLIYKNKKSYQVVKIIKTSN